MPLFTKKPSESVRRKLEHKLYLARESRSSIYDLSDCELINVPKGVYASVKVMQKKILLLQNNSLQGLDGGGKLQDLYELTNLDLSFNELSELPSEFQELKSLQSLNLRSNKFTKYPDPINKLCDLRSLNIEHNKIKYLPDEFCSLTQLRELYLDGNPILMLPRRFYKLCSLLSVTISLETIVYPPKENCGSVEDIMKWLCTDLGIVYESLPQGPDLTESSTTNFTSDVSHTEPSCNLSEYEKKREEKRLRALETERQRMDSLLAHAELKAKASETRIQALNRLAEAESRAQEEISMLQAVRDQRRLDLLASLRIAELHADQLMAKLLAENEVSFRQEEASEEQNEEELSIGKSSGKFGEPGSTALRRSEILNDMKDILLASEQALQRRFLEHQSAVARIACDQLDADKHLDKILANRRQDQSDLLARLTSEEEAQKRAFQQLQAAKDFRTQHVSRNIILVQAELARLTAIELDNRQRRTDERSEAAGNALLAARTRLLDLLTQLFEERSKREVELKKRLSEMEQQRDLNQCDYWLIQYQRLLDRKPASLVNKLDDDIYKILETSKALDFVPHFQRHQITTKSLMHMSEEDLIQIGIYALGIRKAIFQAIQDHLCSCNKLQISQNSQPSAPEYQANEVANDLNILSTRGETLPNSVQMPSAPEDEVLARFEAECCVCQAIECSIIFLPCGHVCCCQACGGRVSLCPLCRTEVAQRIFLERPILFSKE